jgi:hypothetical protein
LLDVLNNQYFIAPQSFKGYELGTFSRNIWLPLSGLCLPLSSVQRYHFIFKHANH